MTAVPESSPSAGDLTPYVPRVVVDWLRENPEARRRELEGTLAFVDISGFTALNERLAQKGKLGAEEVTEVMNRTFERLLDVAYAAGGGLLHTSSTAAQRSCRARLTSPFSDLPSTTACEGRSGGERRSSRRRAS